MCASPGNSGGISVGGGIYPGFPIVPDGVREGTGGNAFEDTGGVAEGREGGGVSGGGGLIKEVEALWEPICAPEGFVLAVAWLVGAGWC